MKKSIFKAKKIKVRLTKMNTEFGFMPILQSNTKVNRDTNIYYAEKTENKGRRSIFFLLRIKDVELLKNNGYTIKSATLKAGFYPYALDYGKGNGTIIEQLNY